jgi:hypothetical protein
VRLSGCLVAKGEDENRYRDQDSGSVAVATAAMYRGYIAMGTPAEDLTQDQIDWLFLDSILRPELHKILPRYDSVGQRTLIEFVHLLSAGFRFDLRQHLCTQRFANRLLFSVDSAAHRLLTGSLCCARWIFFFMLCDSLVHVVVRSGPAADAAGHAGCRHSVQGRAPGTDVAPSVRL